MQAQNEQLKVQCGLLTEELSKLRATFDAILKAGDNLQSDYDQLQAEKDKLHDQLEVVLREKEEVRPSALLFLLTKDRAFSLG